MVFLLALSLIALMPIAKIQAASPDTPEMDFVLVRAQGCSENCPEWISAEGRFSAKTPGRFKKFFARLGKARPQVVLQSEGGDVDAALEVGRQFRNAGLEVSIGGTRLKGCKIAEPRCKAGVPKKGPAIGTTYTSGAYCVSACPFAFAGGVERLSAVWSEIAVHQITTTYDDYDISYIVEYKLVRGKKKEVSRREVGRKFRRSRSTTKLPKGLEKRLNAYFKEMGVSPALMIMVNETPASELRVIQVGEAQQLSLVTELIGANDAPGLKKCGPGISKQMRCRIVTPTPYSSDWAGEYTPNE